MSLIPAFRRQADLCEFKSRVRHRESARHERATENPDLKNTNKITSQVKIIR